MMKSLCGVPVIEHVIRRLKKVKNADALIVATSNLVEDDDIIKVCNSLQVSTFRGSDSDVLERFYQAAVQYKLSDIVRVCADNTLIDWNIIMEEIAAYRTGKYQLVNPSNNIPLGLGAEIFSFSMLKDAYENATEYYQHEHVTPYIYEKYRDLYCPPFLIDYSKYRLTLDEQRDWELIQRIYGELYHGEHNFALKEVVNLLEQNEDWYKINCDVHQKQDKE